MAPQTLHDMVLEPKSLKTWVLEALRLGLGACLQVASITALPPAASAGLCVAAVGSFPVSGGRSTNRKGPKYPSAWYVLRLCSTGRYHCHSVIYLDVQG